MFSPLFMISLVILVGCSYSFTGSSVPAHLKSINIPVFTDKSGSGEFDLNRRITDKLIQKFRDDNSLAIGERANADSYLEGTITGLSDTPSIVSGGEKVSTRRITVTVRAVYKDRVKKITVFEKNFSNYSDYPTVNFQAGDDVVSARKRAIDSSINLITEDILLAVVSNW